MMDPWNIIWIDLESVSYLETAFDNDIHCFGRISLVEYGLLIHVSHVDGTRVDITDVLFVDFIEKGEILNES